VIVSRRPKATRTFQYAALGCYMVFLAFPLLWMLSVSFKGPRELVELHPHLVPSHATLQNYRDAFSQNGLVHSAWNSFKVATLTSLLTTLVGLPAAYVLARQKGLI
jgi:multiple sugar transport system permease protein